LGFPDINTAVIPNLKGKTIREALKLVDFSKLRVIINGSGVVIKQSPLAGKKLINNQVLTLTCVES
jgi:hypothetical protein